MPEEIFETAILFLIFNRPDTTQRVFEQIRKVKPKRLYVAADGPRIHVAADVEKCAETRHIIQGIDWDCDLKTLYRNDNQSCGPAVSEAISWFFEQEEEGIILEDDCLPESTFFTYCNELLKKYRNSTKVMMISGTKLVEYNIPPDDYYFTRYANIWGWASWRRAWSTYQFTINDDKDAINNTLKILPSKSEKGYWLSEFLKVKSKKINTWDYQLLYTIWQQDGLAISPSTNLIKNIGFHNNSTRTFLYDSMKMPDSYFMRFPLNHPLKIEANQLIDQQIFSNVYSHKFPRIYRLLRENGLITVIKYLLKPKS